MAIAEQEAASDFISIKQVWLKQIDRVNELLTNYMLKGDSYSEQGIRAAVSSVNVLVMNLIDYGDSPIKSEFKEWWNTHGHEYSGKSAFHMANKQFEKVIEILNKYQMLHDNLPEGYSNVTMESVKKVKVKE